METDVPEKDSSLTTTPALEKDSSLTTTPASDKDPSLTTTQASEKDPSLTTTPTSEKDPSLLTTPVFEKDSYSALEKDPYLTTNSASEKDSFSTNQASEKDSFSTNQASEKDLSLTTTQVLEKDPYLASNQVSEKEPSLTTTPTSEKDPSLTTIEASENDPFFTTSQASEKEPSLTTTPASAKDSYLRTIQVLENNPSLITIQATEKDLSLTTAQALERDPSLSQASEKDASLTATPASENDSSLTTIQTSEKDPSLTTIEALDLSLTRAQALERDPSLTTSQASEKDASLTATPASVNDPYLTTIQMSEKDPSLTTIEVLDQSLTTTPVSEKALTTTPEDPSLTTTQATEKDSFLITTPASEKDPSSTTTQATEKDSFLITTPASEKNPSLTTQAFEKDLSLIETRASEDPSVTTQVSEKDSSSTTTQVSEKIQGTQKIFEKAKFSCDRLPSDVSSLSLPPSGSSHRRSKSDVSSGNGNKRGVTFQKWKSQVQKAFKWGKGESKNYNFNPEILADQKRQWYQLHSNSSGLTYKEPTCLFEHFIIAGLHPNSNLEVVETAYARQKRWELHNGNKEAPDPKTMQHSEPPSLEPEILFQYPPGNRLSMSPKDLAAFCFPNSVKAHVLERTPSLSELNEIVFGQEYLSTDDLSFVFSLKVADNATLYGVCLLVKEIVQIPPAPCTISGASTPHSHTMLGASIPDSRSYEGCSRVLTSAPRCYCVLTRAPFFELHYEMLKSIIAQERLTRITHFVNYTSLRDHAPAVSRSNDQKKENENPPKEEHYTDWMATAIPIDSAVAITAAAAGIISDDEIFSSSSRGEQRSSESTSTETSEHSHVQEIVNESGKNSQSLDDYTSEASETLRDGLDVEQKLEVVAGANPKIYAMDHIASSESLISSVSSMDDDEKLSCSNDEVSREYEIVEWAKDNNNALLQIVCSYYSMHFPERGGEIAFKPLEHLQTVEYQRPSVSALTQTEKHLNKIKWDTLSALEGNKKLAAAEEAAALSIWTTAAICRALSLENILILLTGVLLEKQVLVVCPNLGVLSAMVLSIIPIIRPFQWQSLFLPVLPGKMIDFLDAPVPFVVGMQHVPTDFKLRTSNLIYVNVAKDQVKSCKLPTLPDYKDLISELGPIYFKMSKHHSIAKRRPVYKYNETEAEAAGRFLAVMRRYLYSLCTDLRSYTITSVRANNDRVSILLKDSFLDSFPSKDQSFMKLFLDTQLFSVLSDSFLSNYEN